jgi:transketolase
VAAAGVPGPVFLRLGRAPTPILTDEDDPFEVGKARVLRPGRDVTLVACGIMVAEALRAADALAQDGVDAGVINVHTIKPLDEAALVQAAQATGAVVTAEEHQVHGGLGSAVAEVVTKHCPCFIDMVAVPDVFGESGEADELREKYGLTYRHIREKALGLLKKKDSHR